ncbi:hypothetical protein [Priestia megaterium]|uniref:hypothetical protein n=1 Tax=Priestia megaterium TaxID=1404 RepID=UPI002FFDB377
MKNEAILKILQEANLIDSSQPTTEDLTCEEKCEAKLAVAIAACALFPDPFSKAACVAAAKSAFDKCSDKCD